MNRPRSINVQQSRSQLFYMKKQRPWHRQTTMRLHLRSLPVLLSLLGPAEMRDFCSNPGSGTVPENENNEYSLAENLTYFTRVRRRNVKCGYSEEFQVVISGNGSLSSAWTSHIASKGKVTLKFESGTPLGILETLFAQGRVSYPRGGH